MESLRGKFEGICEAGTGRDEEVGVISVDSGNMPEIIRKIKVFLACGLFDNKRSDVWTWTYIDISLCIRMYCIRFHCVLHQAVPVHVLSGGQFIPLFHPFAAPIRRTAAHCSTRLCLANLSFGRYFSSRDVSCAPPSGYRCGSGAREHVA